MTDEQNLEIVRQTYGAFGRGDIPGLLTLLDPHVSWVTPGPADLPTAGTRRGHADVAEFFQTLASVMDVMRFEPKEFIVQGDRVVVLGDETSRVRASGRSLEFRWVHVFTVRAGRIEAFEEVGDVSSIVTEIRSAQIRA